MVAGLRCVSATARLLGFARSNPFGGRNVSLSLVNVVCCQVEVSATGRSLVIDSDVLQHNTLYLQ